MWDRNPLSYCAASTGQQTDQQQLQTWNTVAHSVRTAYWRHKGVTAYNLCFTRTIIWKKELLVILETRRYSRICQRTPPPKKKRGYDNCRTTVTVLQVRRTANHWALAKFFSNFCVLFPLFHPSYFLPFYTFFIYLVSSSFCSLFFFYYLRLPSSLLPFLHSPPLSLSVLLRFLSSSSLSFSPKLLWSHLSFLSSYHFW